MYRAVVLLALTLLSLACEGEQSMPTGPAMPPPAGGQWNSLPGMPMPRFYVGVGAARGKVFVVGGFNEADGRLVHAFDTAAGTWATVPPLPASFKMANVVGVGDRLLVLGALETKLAVEFDFATQGWKDLPPLPLDRGTGTAAVGVHGSQVLLAGGVLKGQSANMLNTGVRIDNFIAFDTATNTWSTLPEMPVAVGYAMGAVLGNEFWVMGGSTAFARTDQVLAYDVTTRTWNTKPPLPRSLSSAAVGVLAGWIYLTGGIATSVGMISPDTMVLDPKSGKWTTTAPIITPRFGMSAAVVDGKLYVPSGLATGPNMYDPTAAFEVYVP